MDGGASRGGELAGDWVVGDVGGHDGFEEMARGAVAGSAGGLRGSGVAGVELPPPPRKRRTPFMM